MSFSTLDRYLLREILLPLGVGLLLFCVVLAFAQLLQVSDAVTGLGVGASDILAAIMYSFPPLMGLLLPVSLLFATLLAVGRISSDREIRGLSAGGVNPFDLFRIPAFLGVLIAVLSGLAMVYGEPWGIRGLRDLMARGAQRALAAGVRPGHFHEWLPDVAFFAADRHGSELKGIFFADMRNPTRPVVIAAKRGVVRSGRDARDLVLEMEEGNLLSLGASKDPHVLAFATGRYRLDVEINKARTLHPLQEKTNRELWEESKDTSIERRRRVHRIIILHRRFAMPIAALIFALLAVPLAAGNTSSARARGFIYSGVIIGAYYYIGRALEVWARSTGDGWKPPPEIAAWSANALALLGVIVLIVRFQRRAV